MWRGEMGYRLAEQQFWWIHAMIAEWLVIAAMLFVIEPMFLHRRMATSPRPARDYARMERMHRLPLGASAIMIGAAGGSHGLL